MKILADFENVTEKIRTRGQPGTINLVFAGYFALFLADNVINHYIHLPAFVAGAMMLTIFLLPYALVHIRRDAWLVVGLLLLLLIMVVNSLKDDFAVRNVSDYFFLALFVISYMAYSSSIRQLKMKYAGAFIASCLILLLLPSALAWIGADPGVPTFVSEDTYFLHFREAIARHYHRGFYRFPHVASYFFGFSAFFIMHLAQREKKQLWWWTAGLILLLLAMYTGARAFGVAMLLSLSLFLLHKKKYAWLMTILVGLALIIVFRSTIFNLLEGSFLQQHFALVISFVEDLDGFPRIMIWRVWLAEVSDFSWHELFIGRSYVTSLTATQEYLGIAIWFHNDFFSIFYSYGVNGKLQCTFFRK